MEIDDNGDPKPSMVTRLKVQTKKETKTTITMTTSSPHPKPSSSSSKKEKNNNNDNILSTQIKKSKFKLSKKSRKHDWSRMWLSSHFQPFLLHDAIYPFSPRESGAARCFPLGNYLPLRSGNEDCTVGLPNHIIVNQCRKCHSYSHRGAACWIKVPPLSDELLSFLVKKFAYSFHRSNVSNWDAHFLPPEPHSSSMNIGLKLEIETSKDSKLEKVHTVECAIAYQVCPECSLMEMDTSCWSCIVQLRQNAPHRRTLHNLERIIPRYRSAFRLMGCKRNGRGMDFFFGTERDALAFYNLVCGLAPIKRERVHRATLPRDSAIRETCIPAVISPICREDLVYLPSKVSAQLGISPLVICVGVTRDIVLLDTVQMRTVALCSDAYWRTPFESIMTSRNLVEFLVLDVDVPLPHARMTAHADVQVARVSDFGKNDIVFCGKTHLGSMLKPGDNVYGYVLDGTNFANEEAEKCRDKLPDFVLIRKKYDMKKSTKPKPKQGSAEYLQFLNDLQKNPEAIFNLSLDGATEEKQTSDMTATSSRKNIDIDLEDLFADLGLGDQLGGDNPGNAEL